MGMKSLCVFLLVAFTLWRCVLLEELQICQDANNTTESCCPCFLESMDNCSTACPELYLLVMVLADSETCESNLTSATITTITATTETVTFVTPGMENSNVTQNATGDQSEEDEMLLMNQTDRIFICMKSCPKYQHYSNKTRECLKCDQKCLECRWPDRENCIVCRYEFNKTCVAQCPEGMVESENKNNTDGSKLCVKKPEAGDSPKSKLPIIIGCSAGGVVVAIIVVIVIIVYCRRRRGTRDVHVGRRSKGQRTAMSELLENQQSGGESGKEDTSRAGGRRPGNYENTSQTLPTNRQIQEQGDNVLRYTKDPTVKNQNEETVEVEEESPYGNAAMISLHKKVDVTERKTDELTEMLDVEEMGEAPGAPVAAQAKTPLPVSTRGKKRTGKSKPKSPEHEPEDYIDMSSGPGPTTEDEGPVAGMEDYENFNFDKIPQGRKAVVVTSPEDGMELYENTEKGDNSDLEDYENAKQFRKKPAELEKPSEEEADNMEDYENMKELELYENTEFNRK